MAAMGRYKLRFRVNGIPAKAGKTPENDGFAGNVIAR
jgi:hypothetical protein